MTARRRAERSKTRPNSGTAEARKALDIILHHPAAAMFRGADDPRAVYNPLRPLRRAADARIAGVAAADWFNHQTHHRGQVQVMLAQTEVEPPSLDLHRLVNP